MNRSHNSILTWLDHSADKCLKYKKQLLFSIVGALAVCGGFVGYSLYNKHKDALAYKEFVSALKYYDGIVMTKTEQFKDPGAKYFTSEQDKWHQTENVFAQGYQTHKNSNLGCMFLAFKAEAILNQGKKDEAIKLFNDAISKMPNNDLVDYYKVKLALIKIDKNDEQGLSELEKIAGNEQSVANDLALYQLGAYYWAQRNYSQAKNFWQQLVVKAGGNKAGINSPFVQEVKEKLSLYNTEIL